MNIKTKFVIWFNATIVCIILFFSSVTYFSVLHGIQEGINNRLFSIAEATTYIISRPPINFAVACGSKELDDILRAFLGYSEAEGYVRIVNADGKVASCTTGTPIDPVNLRHKDLDELTKLKYFFKDIKAPEGAPEDQLRILFYPLMIENKFAGYLEIGTSLLKLENMRRSLIQIFVIIIPIALLLSNLGGIIIFSRGVHPLLFLSSQLKSISANELYRRIPVPDQQDEVRDLYESINNMMARLEKSFEQIKQFSADASHELRTPLTIVKGEIQVAFRSERTVEEYQDILISVLEEIEHMIRIVEDLLLLSKSDAGEILIEKREINIKNLLCDLCEQLCMFAEDKEVTLDCKDMQDVVIRADSLRLRQVFTNIIENAIKYNVPKGRVWVDLKPVDDSVMIEVRDTGVGMKQEDIPRIFDRFYRADKSRKREVGGAGLGLSICKWIIEGHGGYIDVSSEFGKGSIFRIVLPRS